jgi:hypothetical protein
VFGQEKLISDEHLPDFLNCLAYLWEEGLSGKKIAEEMGFGEPCGYPNLKVEHVYYFVEKYGKELGLKSRKVMTGRKKRVPEGMVAYDPTMPPDYVQTLLKAGRLYGFPEDNQS